MAHVVAQRRSASGQSVEQRPARALLDFVGKVARVGDRGRERIEAVQGVQHPWVGIAPDLRAGNGRQCQEQAE